MTTLEIECRMDEAKKRLAALDVWAAEIKASKAPEAEKAIECAEWRREQKAIQAELRDIQEHFDA